MSDTSPTTAEQGSTAARAIELMVELLEIGREAEMHTEPWGWPMARRIFRAQAKLRHIVGEAFR